MWKASAFSDVNPRSQLPDPDEDCLKGRLEVDEFIIHRKACL